MRLDVQRYPTGYFDFTGGKYISNSEIDQWVKECILELEEDPKKSCSIRASGNAMVQVHVEDNIYCVTVSKNYKTMHIEKQQ